MQKSTLPPALTPHFLLLYFLGNIAFAQSPLTLNDAITVALNTNATISAGEQRVKFAEALTVQAGLGPNPRLTFQHENIRAWERPGPVYLRDTDTFLYASQTIEVAGKRRLRVETSSAGVARAEAEQQIVRRQVALRVAGAFWAALGAERVQQLLVEEEGTLIQTVRYTEDRVREGAAAGTDLLRMRLEQQRVSALLAVASQDSARSRARLFQEMGLSVLPQTYLSGDLAEERIVTIPDLVTILERRPEIQAARRAILQAEANSKLQRANSRQDPDLLAGFKRTAGFDTLIVGVQINLPVRNRNQGLIQAADAEVRGAEALLRGVEAQVETEVKAGLTDYNLKRDLVIKTLPAMLRNARESSQLATLAWKEGGIDILRLLDTERVRIEVELQYARALTDYQQSANQLSFATGVNP
jgi:cobalt-zinc-cadmium efflux system outer membrane protein